MIAGGGAIRQSLGARHRKKDTAFGVHTQGGDGGVEFPDNGRPATARMECEMARPRAGRQRQDGPGSRRQQARMTKAVGEDRIEAEIGDHREASVRAHQDTMGMSTFLPVRMMSTPAMRPARSGRPQPAIGAHRIDHDAMIRPLVLGTHAVVDDQQMTSLAVEAVMGRDAAEARLLVEEDQTFGRGIVTVGADEALVPAKHLGIDVDTSRSRRHRQERRIIDTPVLREQRGSSRRRVEAEDREANPAGRLEIGGVTVQTPYDHRDLGHGVAPSIFVLAGTRLTGGPAAGHAAPQVCGSAVRRSRCLRTALRR